MNWIDKIGKEYILIKVKLEDFETFQKFMFTLNVEWQDSKRKIQNEQQIYYRYIEDDYIHLLITEKSKLVYKNNLYDFIIFDLRKLKLKKIASD